MLFYLFCVVELYVCTIFFRIVDFFRSMFVIFIGKQQLPISALRRDFFLYKKFTQTLSYIRYSHFDAHFFLQTLEKSVSCFYM